MAPRSSKRVASTSQTPGPVDVVNGFSSSDSGLSPEIQALRKNWKWANVSQFIYVFQPLLGTEDITILDLEVDLAIGSSNVIPRLMQRLLVVLTQDRKINPENWQHHLRRQYLRRDPDLSPLGTEEEPVDWSSLSPSDRLDCLHILCEWQFNNPTRFRLAMKDDDENAYWRQEPIGFDKHNNAYWLCGGEFLWIQRATPSRQRSAPKKRAKRKALPIRAAPPTKRARASPEQETPPPKANGRARRAAAVQASSKMAATALYAFPPAPTGTRSSSRLRRGEGDVWQEIPKEWLMEDVQNSDSPKQESESSPDVALKKAGLASDDDVSELTELSDHESGEDPEEEIQSPEQELASDSEDEFTPPANWVEWETICVTLGEWETITQRFEGATQWAEKTLLKVLRDSIVPLVTAALKERIRTREHELTMVNRKRSSRIESRESKKEEERLATLKLAEENEKLERAKRAEARQRKEEEAREKRERAREERRLAREAEIALQQKQEEEEEEVEERKSSRPRMNGVSMDLDVIGEADVQPFLMLHPQAGSNVASTSRPKSTKSPASKSQSAKKSSSKPAHAAKRLKHDKKRLGKDDWVLDCEVCRQHGINLDDGKEITCCEGCFKWQHVACHDQRDAALGRARRDWQSVDFWCSSCLDKQMRIRLANTQGRSETSQLNTQHRLPPINQYIPTGHAYNPMSGVQSMYSPQPAAPQSIVNGYTLPPLAGIPSTNGVHYPHAQPQRDVTFMHYQPPTSHLHPSLASYQQQRAPNGWAGQFQASNPFPSSALRADTASPSNGVWPMSQSSYPNSHDRTMQTAPPPPKPVYTAYPGIPK